MNGELSIDPDFQSKFKPLFRFTNHQANVELSSLLLYALSFSCYRKGKCVKIHQERPPNKYNVIVRADILCCICPNVSLRAQVSQRVQSGLSRHLTYWMAHRLNQ